MNEWKSTQEAFEHTSCFLLKFHLFSSPPKWWPESQKGHSQKRFLGREFLGNFQREHKAQMMESESRPMPASDETISWAGGAGGSGAKISATLTPSKTHYQIMASEINFKKGNDLCYRNEEVIEAGKLVYISFFEIRPIMFSLKKNAKLGKPMRSRQKITERWSPVSTATLFLKKSLQEHRAAYYLPHSTSK